jgi:hypothetical protein
MSEQVLTKRVVSVAFSLWQLELADHLERLGVEWRMVHGGNWATFTIMATGEQWDRITQLAAESGVEWKVS